MNYHCTHVRPFVARGICLSLVLAAGTLLAAACRPIVPATPASPTRAADAAPTAWADATPDAAGYYANPDGSWFEPLEAGPLGPLLVDVHAALDDGIDAGRLVAHIAPDGARGPSIIVADGIAATAALTATRSADEVSSALARLRDAGSTPRVQGFAAPPIIPWPDEDDSDVSAWVVINGWQGEAGLLDGGTAPRARPGGDAIDVWRFERSGDDWTWVEWAMPQRGFRAVVADALQAAAPPRSERDAYGNTAVFRSVRPRAWWPENNAPCKDVSASPDGAWIACSGELGAQPFGPRTDDDAGGWRQTYMARRLEVRSADGDVVHRPVDDWTGDGAIGVESIGVLGWLDAPPRLVFGGFATGDGCGLFLYGGNTRLLDLATGRVTPIGFSGYDLSLDAAHHRLASAGGAIDLDSGRRWTFVRDDEDTAFQSGNVVWSPDGGAVVVTDAWDACSDDWRERIVRFDLDAGTRTVLVPPTLGTHRVARWGRDDVLTIQVDDPPWADNSPLRIERRNARTGALVDPANDPGANDPLDGTLTPFGRNVEGPDDAGYFVSPDAGLRHASGYVPLELGPVGGLLVEMQAKLAAEDFTWLAARIDPTSAELRMHGMNEESSPFDVAAPDVAAALTNLVAQGSRPVVQGYYASANGDPVVFDAADARDLVTADTVDVVVAGWTGTSRLFTSAMRPNPAPGASVWRFVRTGGVGGADGADPADALRWRWQSWRFVVAGNYPFTVARMEHALAAAAEDRPPYYHVVRPADRWPSPVPTVGREVPSPDGLWTAREVSSAYVPIEPRDPVYKRELTAVDVVDAKDKVVGRPVAYWEAGDMGGRFASIEGWWPERNELLVADLSTGDGCILHARGSLWRFQPATGRTIPVSIGPDVVFDPEGRQMAAIGLVGDGQDDDGQFRFRGVVEVLDVDAGTVVSATFAAAEYDDRPVWSPDGSAVVFTVVDAYEMCADFRASHIARFDVATRRVTNVTASAPGFRRVTAWRPDGTLDVDVFDAGYVKWDDPAPRTEQRDAVTGALLSAATATPRP
ncbi:MAG: hypothetical protein IT332_09440 [Ardenticatenales bacterium]|nr:hypothetical protein [Ardenticatenales bacterium]